MRRTITNNASSNINTGSTAPSDSNMRVLKSRRLAKSILECANNLQPKPTSLNDAQFLGYLVVDYTPEEYEAEVKRLEEYKSTEYVGYYCVEEEHTYELLAIRADAYQGFVYALTDGEGRIIYAEQIFCNYFMDLDYKEYIPEEYLLDGFDATTETAYYQKMTGK